MNHDAPPVPSTFVPRTRDNCPALDALLGYSWPVGSKGFVELWDYLGNETAVAQAARTSYKSTGKSADDDKRLVRRLMADRHTSPNEMAELKLKVRCPLFVARQLVRHRSANMNEWSGRYTELPDDFDIVDPACWRTQSQTNKQGSGGLLPVEVGQGLTDRQIALQKLCYDVYQDRIAAGVAREQARIDLPLSIYTEFVWKFDLHNLLHFLGLRMDAHAQQETRDFANVIGDIVKLWMPSLWQAFVDFRLEAITLSGLELKLLSCSTREEAHAMARGFGWLERRADGSLKPHSERAHFEAFCNRIGESVSW